MTTKKDLLEKYAHRDVHAFMQMDGWITDGGYDSIMKCDEDGDVLCSGSTFELRRSPKDLAVRVFIHEGTKHEDAIRLLKKLTAWAEDDPHFFEFNEIDAEMPQICVKTSHAHEEGKA